MTDRPIILIIEPQPLIRLDIAQQLQEVAPEAQVLEVASLAAGASAIGSDDRLAGVVLCASLAEIRASGLEERARRDGAWIVCVDCGSPQEAAEAGWHFLGKPFYSEQAIALFHRLLGPAGA